MKMISYQIRLLETRMADDETDDVALFDVICREDGRSWRVPVFLSPLFRLLCMETQPSVESRREMVAGLGARRISDWLRQGLDLNEQEPLVFATNYPGAPGEPEPLLPYEDVTVSVSGVETDSPSVQG
jgi:hypothetical protein